MCVIVYVSVYVCECMHVSACVSACKCMSGSFKSMNELPVCMQVLKRLSMIQRNNILSNIFMTVTGLSRAKCA